MNKEERSKAMDAIKEKCVERMKEMQAAGCSWDSILRITKLEMEVAIDELERDDKKWK